MTRVEGSWGNSNQRWYGYAEYYVGTNSSTTYRIEIPEIGFRSNAWGFSISSVTVKYGATGWPDWYYGSGPVSTSTGQSKDVPIVTDTWFSWDKGHSAQTKKIEFYVTNTSGYENGESYKSFEVTVPAKPSYTISYNANGGSGAPASHTKWYGEDTTLWNSSHNPTRTGYTFRGWGTSSTATSASYQPGATITANKSLSLYAVWQANTYTVSYNANGGSGAPASQTKTYGKALTLSSTVPTRTNYDFLGWATSSGGAVAYQPGGSYTANSGASLYAVWQLAYKLPTISGLNAQRCDSDGTLNDEGTCALVSFSWADNEGNVPTAVSATVDGSTVSATPSGTSGTYSQVVGSSLDVANAYTVTATVTDAGGTSTASTRLTPAQFTMELLAGGKGVTFGGPATAEGAHFLMDVFLGSLQVTDHFVENGSVTTSDGFNWRYRKLASGWMVAWGYVSLSQKAETAWGSSYYGDVASYANPFTYAAAPYEFHALANNKYFTLTNNVGATTTKTGSYYAVCPTKQSTARSVQLQLLQIGRWK